MGMYLKDNHVYADYLGYDEHSRQQEGLVVSRYKLSMEISYINENQIQLLDITLGDPRVFVDKEFSRRVISESTPHANAHIPNYDVDISVLRKCAQLKSLALCGNIVHGETLQELPFLRCLSIDNTLGKNKIDLSNLQHLHTLLIQKPGRNVIGFEHLSGLHTLRIWNYTPKSRNLSELSSLEGLEVLDLIQPRIDSLEGIEQCPALQRIEIYRSRTLKDTSALEKCERHIEFVCNPMPVH